MARPRLCAAGIELRAQVDARWPKRDRRSDGWIGDWAHQQRISDHNPDPAGWVRAIDLDADLAKVGVWDLMMQLADQLRLYAKSGAEGADRLKYLVYRDRVCSGTYRKSFWTWRGSGYGHFDHLHVSFHPAGDRDGRPFPVPILQK